MLFTEIIAIYCGNRRTDVHFMGTTGEFLVLPLVILNIYYWRFNDCSGSSVWYNI